MRAWVLCLSLGLLSAGAQASVFKSECNLDKAVKNEALNATLGSRVTAIPTSWCASRKRRPRPR